MKRNILPIEYNNPNFILRFNPTSWTEAYWFYNGQIFTGIMNYANTNLGLYGESEFKDGVLNGRQVEYWRSLFIKTEFFQKDDYCIGSFKRWNEEGLLISHEEFDESGNYIKTIVGIEGQEFDF